MPIVQPTSRQYSHLIAEIEKGDIKIPQFQREFIWDIARSARLLDSILKGYPIGSFVLWKTNESLRSVRGIGRNSFPARNGETINYILDGQQRLTSIYCCLKGEKINRVDNSIVDYSDIYIDLDANENEQMALNLNIIDDEKRYIKFTKLLTEDFELLLSYEEKRRRKIQEYRQRIISYNFPIIEISDASIEIATEIFTRINLGGKPLTVFEIMVAKTYDEDKKFDLTEKCLILKNRLKTINYETISETTFLQVMAAVINKDITSKSILKLNRDDFIDAWEKVVDAIERSCEYLKSYYRIPVSQLLPYNALIIAFSYFFYHHSDKPIGYKQNALENYFWRTSLAARYSSSLETKMNQDLNKIELILNDKDVTYDWPLSISPEHMVNNGFFNASRSFVKAILCIYTYHEPKSFIDNSIVNISNDWLKQANSKNYHHFFPKKSIACRDKEWLIVNNVFNIAIVDDFLNKRSIKARNPSDYISQYRKNNPALNEALNSHLISDDAEFGIDSDDIVKFTNQRARNVSDFLKSRIINLTDDNNIKLDDDEEYIDSEILEEDEI